MAHKRFAVTGGRSFTDLKLVIKTLDNMPMRYTLVHGNAPGADSLCRDYWEYGLCSKTEAFPADWERLGRAAGPIRNTAMVNSGLDFVVAFPGDTGVVNMTRQALRKGITVYNASHLLTDEMWEDLLECHYTVV